MMKQTGKLLALMLVLVLGLSGCGIISVNKEKDDQTVVAQFTGGTITKGTAMAEYDDVVEYYKSYGYELTDADTIKAIKQDLLDYLCEEAIVHAKAEELGLTAMTDDEKADLTAETTASFNEAIDYYMIYFEGETEEESRQSAIDFLAQQNYTLESELQYVLDNAWQEKINTYVTKDVVAGEADIQAAYDELVAADEEAYSDSAYDFEYAITSGETVSWMPEGYRTVKHILIPFSDEQVEKLDDLTTQLEDVRYQLAGGNEEGDLTGDDDGHDHTDEELALLLESDGAASDEPASEPQPEDMLEAEPEPDDAVDEAAFDDAELDGFDEVADVPVMSVEELQAEEKRLSAELQALQAEYAATLQDKVAEVQAKIQAGADFDALIAEYGEDMGMQEEPGKTQGYYVSANSEMWEEVFTKAAMALAKVGDVSEPIVGSNGIHIIRYMSDVVPGPVSLEQVRATAEENALTSAKEAKYEETVAQWVAAANVKTYVDRMK